MRDVLLGLVLLGSASLAPAAGEYFVGLTEEQKALSRELQLNARQSQKYIDSEMPSRTSAWFVGSARTEAGAYHILAYFTNPKLSRVGIFHDDKKLADLWRFPYDARQFYVEGTKLMFAVRARLHLDDAESWAQVERQMVIDFAAIPPDRQFSFHGVRYRLSPR